MNMFIPRLLALLLLACAAARASELPLDRRIEIAFHAVDADALAALRAETEIADAGKSPAEATPERRYLRAFAHYGEAALARAQRDTKETERHFEAAIALLETIKAAPLATEAAALHAGILGQLIGLKGGMSGMTLGPKAGKLRKQALAARPANPRVLLFEAISLLNTPKQWGGDPAKALSLLENAAKLFEKPSGAFTWGHAETLTWLGLARQKHGDAAGARAAWEQALALEPEFAWVKYDLLPSVKPR